MANEQSQAEGRKDVDPARSRLCERALSRLGEGADPDELAVAIFQEGEFPLEVVGAVVGTLWRVLGGADTKALPTPIETVRFALGQITSGVDPETLAQSLELNHGMDAELAAWNANSLSGALRGNFEEEEEFSILDLSPWIRIAAGMGGLVFFAALTAWSLSGTEPGGTVPVAVGALLASGALVLHGLVGIVRKS